MRHGIGRAMAAAILFATVAVGPLSAGPMEDGYAAIQRGDPETALRLWRPLADEGNVNAQFNLGYLYDKGQGVRQNFVEAMRWFRKAADQGDAISQFTIGTMYEVGKGVPVDAVQAHMWFSLAAARFQPTEEKASYDRAVAARERVAAGLTPAQVAEAQKRAREWRP